MKIEAVVFDLDGVVRHFDQDRLADVERSHGLAPGELAQVAFESVDRKLLRVVDALRWRGLTVALLTNGTDTIPDEMVEVETLKLDLRTEGIEL